MGARLVCAWRRSWRSLIVLAAAGGLLAALPAGGFADTVAPKVRFGGDQTSTRVVLDIDRAVQGKLISGGQGGREFIIDFPKLTVSDLDGAGRGLVGQWTLQRTVGGARLKLQLDKGATIEKRFLLAPADGVTSYRYVIDLKAAGAPAATPPARVAIATTKPSLTTPASVATQKVVPTPAVLPRATSSSSKKIIVLDAGHGGKDGGAAGSSVNEKEVTLAVAKALKQRLEKSGRYRVVLTRETDTFIALDNRLHIAQRAKADLFISLHADASTNPATRGASVYTISDKGADRAARREGGQGFLNVAAPGGTKVLRDILFDLTQRATRNKSTSFADILITKVGGHAPLLSRAHRDASYWVLLAPDVPSVLFEMGFITNKQDEALLTSETHRAKIVNGLASAVDEYFAQDNGVSSL